MKILKIALVLLSLILVERFCHYQTAGFKMNRIRSDLTFHPEWETTPLSKEEEKQISSLLDQKFTFLGSGGSCYVFLSEDQQHVIKFFKFHHLDPLHFHLPWTPAKGGKTARIFSSCHLAHTALKQETGMLYLHLNQTHTFKKKLTLIDKLGIAHSLDLDETAFLIQKRATMACDHLTDLMRRGELEKAKSSLDEIWNLLVSILEKRIEDHDMNIQTNCGFLNGKPIKIDVGPFKWDEQMKRPEKRSAILKRTALRFQPWLEKRYPELSLHFKKITERTLSPANNHAHEGI